MKIGLFQIENLIFNRADFTLFDLRQQVSASDSWPSSVEAHQVWNEFWARATRAELSDAVRLARENVPSPQSPVILICETGSTSARAALELEAAGFINVFVVEGGARKLLDEAISGLSV